MDRARIRSLARMVIYVGVAALAWGLLQAVRVYRGTAEAAATGWALIAATVGLALIVPAGYALAMLAQEEV